MMPRSMNKEAMSDEHGPQYGRPRAGATPRTWSTSPYLVEHRALGQKTIDGVLCEGIEATGPDGSTGRIWVAVETGYPVLVEIEGMKGGIRTTGTMDQFRWNVDLSAEGVEPEIPAGYEPL